MIRLLFVVQLLITLVSMPLSASELPSCGGVAGVACEGDSFCDYPVGTCGVGDVEGACKERPEVCTKEYRPVVGCDDRVYSNACMAAAAGVSIKHPYSEPIETVDADSSSRNANDSAKDVAARITYRGKVRTDGSVERRVGRWTVEEVLNTGSDATTQLRIRFNRSVRDAVIMATPYCTFSDHGPASVGYGYFDDRTIDFVYEWPCGFLDAAGLDFLVID